MRVRMVVLGVALLGLGLGAAGCGSGSTANITGLGPSSSAPSKGKLVVGAANFPENAILANLYKGVLVKAGYDASVKSLTTREVIEPALKAGQLDVVPEYVGSLTTYLNGKLNGPKAPELASGDLAKTLANLRTLAGKFGIVALDPAPAQDQNGFAVTQAFAQQHHLSTLSDLGKSKEKVTLGGPAECKSRSNCQPGLKQVYGIDITGFKALDLGTLTKAALKSGTINLGELLTSDPTLSVNNLVMLDDDKHLQNVDNVIAVVNKDSLTPDIAKALNAVDAALSTDELKTLNGRVSEGADPADVAQQYLKDEGLI